MTKKQNIIVKLWRPIAQSIIKNERQLYSSQLSLGVMVLLSNTGGENRLIVLFYLFHKLLPSNQRGIRNGNSADRPKHDTCLHSDKGGVDKDLQLK